MRPHGPAVVVADKPWDCTPSCQSLVSVIWPLLPHNCHTTLLISVWMQLYIRVIPRIFRKCCCNFYSEADFYQASWHLLPCLPSMGLLGCSAMIIFVVVDHRAISHRRRVSVISLGNWSCWSNSTLMSHSCPVIRTTSSVWYPDLCLMKWICGW